MTKKFFGSNALHRSKLSNRATKHRTQSVDVFEGRGRTVGKRGHAPSVRRLLLFGIVDGDRLVVPALSALRLADIGLIETEHEPSARHVRLAVRARSLARLGAIVSTSGPLYRSFETGDLCSPFASKMTSSCVFSCLQ